ncbi:MAG: MoxR family ATPase [Candidatus Sericytochromatia bacterium]
MLKFDINAEPIKNQFIEKITNECEKQRIENYCIIKEKPKYFAKDELIDAVNLAIALEKPLLIQGEPGCGKTTLADLVAYHLGLPLEKFYVKSISKGKDLLYSYDAINRLYDAELRELKDISNYITYNALGRAIKNSKDYNIQSVVLIDEIDKADFDFPNDLLLELEKYEFIVTENKNEHIKLEETNPKPIIIITDNEEKPLPPAFLRRCIFYYLDFPDKDKIKEILELHEKENKNIATDEGKYKIFNQKLADIILEIREIKDLSRKPSLSELIDWAGYLKYFEAQEEDLDKLSYLGALIKNKYDQQRVKDKFIQNEQNS